MELISELKEEREFQFQTGAIKSDISVGIIAFITFQFQTGAIKRMPVIFAESQRVSSFNSKLVRLKGLSARARIADDTKFQFQTGAIKRGTRSA